MNLTDQQQRAILRDLVQRFMQHQTIATDLLNQINTIGLLENEGNPFTRAIKGEDDLLATIRIKGERLPAFVPGGFSTVIEDMKQAADNNGYIV